MIRVLVIVFSFAICSCQLQSQDKLEKKALKKINGVSLVSPPNSIDQSGLASISDVNAGWVSIIPYAFSPGHQPEVHFNSDRQWWGERPAGAEKLIEYAKAEGLKIMLKPHVWVLGDGWTGDYVLDSNEDWLKWEKAYTHYLMTYASMAQKHRVEMLCIGTEFRQVVKQRPDFWPSLADKVRKVYDGSITYAANWDNLENIQFWQAFDYIGVDSYFPLSEEKTPQEEALEKAWVPIKDSLHRISLKYKKPILFTEYGYKSCDFVAAGHWETDGRQASFNGLGQQRAYRALFKTFWKQDWFAGGFLWKWFPYGDQNSYEKNTAFTPQGKPVIEDIKEQYESNSTEQEVVMQEIAIGANIPDITLKDQNGEERQLKSYTGKPLVVYFYPKDDTPGCTIEACSFRDHYEDFKDLGAEVVGVSGDSPQSHANFAKKYKLSFTLLSDTAGKAVKAFGVPRKFFGLTPGRVTYVFDEKGILIKKFSSAIQMKKHVQEALDAISSD